MIATQAITMMRKPIFTMTRFVSGSSRQHSFPFMWFFFNCYLPPLSLSRHVFVMTKKGILHYGEIIVGFQKVPFSGLELQFFEVAFFCSICSLLIFSVESALLWRRKWNLLLLRRGQETIRDTLACRDAWHCDRAADGSWEGRRGSEDELGRESSKGVSRHDGTAERW